MTVVLIPVFLVLFALAAAFVALERFQKERGAEREKLEAEPGSLHYLVPEGQDPALVLARLRDAPFRVALPVSEAPNEVVIAAEPGSPPVDREKVRAVLAEIRETSLDIDTEATLPPVRFADEG